MTLRVAVDTGGTFTDVILQRGAQPLLAHKLLSTPDDPARAVLQGLDAVLSSLEGASRALVIHGSTVATNALLEGKGGRAAFVTNQGFEDTLLIGRQQRPWLYALRPQRPAPPIPTERCLGVPGRVAWDGQELRPLPPEALEALASRLKGLGVEAVAVSLLHSYANPAHEEALGRHLRRALPGVHLTLSHQLLPEMREYERGATCAANAVVAPAMDAYLGRLEEQLGPQRLRIMGSAGGTLTAAEVRRMPVHTVLSGPAGGVVGALSMARLGQGRARIISFDMGGTSTDVSLCDGEPSLTREGEVGPLPVRVPLLDIHTVGAGGGSIAWVDPGGALRVGPASCGAEPGPACYGRQRAPWRPAVTDAHVVLGRLPVDRFLGGGLRLDAEAARQAVGQVAARLGLGLEETALGILRVAEATMARAIKVISVQRGYDLRDFALACFGGAGGLHACSLADELGMAQVLVPRHPGLLSAVGMLFAPSAWSASQTLMLRLPQEGAPLTLDALPEARAALASLRARAHQRLEGEGVPAQAREVEVRAALRYLGQSHELEVALGAGEDLVGAFEQEHQRLYGYRAQGRQVELVTVSVHARGDQGQPTLPRLEAREAGAIPREPLRAWFQGRQEEGWLYERASLLAQDRLEGPCVVTEYSSTTVVPPGWGLRVDGWGNLWLHKEDGA